MKRPPQSLLEDEAPGFGRAFSQGRFPKALASLLDSAAYRSAWRETIKAAEKANDPAAASPPSNTRIPRLELERAR